MGDVLGEVDATSEAVMEATSSYLTALYGQSKGHRWSLLDTKSSLTRRKVPKSWLYLRHSPTCCSMFFGPICSSCCGKLSTSMSLLMNPVPPDPLIHLNVSVRHKGRCTEVKF